METSRLSSVFRSPCFGALQGAAFFFCVFGTAILSPSYIDWQIQNDPGQHYLGWEFFRHESWHFPIGKIVGYGAPEGSSIVYTDSIPLFALLFKLTRTFLPEPFQYTGLWMLFCYVMQGFFGWMLGSLTTHSTVSKALASFMFVISPAMLDRAVGHHALMGHWVLLLALYLALQRKSEFEWRHPRLKWHFAWGLAVVLSALVHMYLHAMVLVVFLASMVSFLHQCRWRGGRNYAVAAVIGLLSPLTLYLEGAFVVRSNDWAPASSNFFGHFSMNLLSPFIPGYSGSPSDTAFVSYFLNSQKWKLSGQIFEGFNYLGVGFWFLIGLVLIAKIALSLKVARLRGCIGWREVLRTSVPYPVLLGIVAMSLFSLSHVVVAGDSTVSDISLSPRLLRYAEVFRSSGRFFWPMGYLLLWWTLNGLARCVRRADAVMGILLLAVGVQALDLSQFFRHHALPFRVRENYSSPLKSPLWSRAMKQYRHVLYYPPGDTSYYIPLGLLAAPAGATINVAYKARDSDRLPEHARVLRNELQSAQLRTDSLYVFRDQSLFDGLRVAAPGLPLLKEVDGFFVAGQKSVGSY